MVKRIKLPLGGDGGWYGVQRHAKSPCLGNGARYRGILLDASSMRRQMPLNGVCDRSDRTILDMLERMDDTAFHFIAAMPSPAESAFNSTSLSPWRATINSRSKGMGWLGSTPRGTIPAAETVASRDSDLTFGSPLGYR